MMGSLFPTPKRDSRLWNTAGFHSLVKVCKVPAIWPIGFPGGLPVQETWVQSPGREDPLEEETATHSSILAWEIPWTEEPGGLQFTRSQRVRQNLAVKQQQQIWPVGNSLRETLYVYAIFHLP